MNKTLQLIILLILTSASVLAQPGNFRGDFNGWGCNGMTNRGPVMENRIQENTTSSGRNYKFDDLCGWANSWGTGGTITKNTKFSMGNGGNSLYSSTSGYYYTFIIQKSTGTLYTSVLETQYNPRTISSKTQTPSTPDNTQSVTVTATLSGALNTGEYCFVRYSTDGWATSSIVAMTTGSNPYSGTIPAQTAGKTVSYYFFTSNQSSIATPADADYYTLELLNNSGSNYSYTVTSATPATVNLSQISVISANNIATSSTNNIIYNFQLGVTVAAATLNQLVIPTASGSSNTYASGDLVNLKLWYNSSNNFGTASTISTITSPANATTQTFASLSQTIAASATGYFWVTADVNSGATAGHTITVTSALSSGNFTFSLAPTFTTGTINAGGIQTIVLPTPSVTLSGISTVSAASIAATTTNNIIYNFQLAVTAAGTTLNTVTFPNTGSYVSGDFTNFKLYYTTTNTFATTNLLQTISAPSNSGTQSFTGLTQNINAGNTGYFWITADVATGATVGHTITVTPALSFSNLTFSSTINSSTGTINAGGQQTISAAPAWGITDFYINAGGSGYYKNGSGGQGSMAFNGSNFGSTGNFYMNDIRLYTTRNSSQSICSGTMYYSAYPSAGSPTTWTAVSLTIGGTGGSGPTTGGSSPQAETLSATSPNINILCGLPSGTSKLAVYFTFSGNSSSSTCPGTADVYTDNNSGNYYILSFTNTNASTVTAVAGTAISTCATSGAVNITAGSSATNYTSVSWTSSGTGTFANSTSLTTCTYTPSAADISAGNVTLTLTATGNGTCSSFSVTSSKTLTIVPIPLVNAGTAVSTCSTSGALNITAGSSASNYATLAWTTSGTGTFANSTSLTTCTYTPSGADITAGAVTLTLTATPNTPCASNVTANKTLTIVSAPSANAGSTSTSICSNGTYAVSGASVSNNASFSWSTGGNGSFSPNNTTLNPVYTPGSSDISGGSVTLTLTATPNSPCASNATATKVLSITTLPVISTQPSTSAQSLCQGSGATQLSVSTSAGTGLSYQWYSNTTASNSGGTLLSGATSSAYTPSSASAGTLYYYVVISSSPCASVTSNVSGGITVKSTGTWLGVTSTDWNTASNWCGGVPVSSTDVIIPSGTPYSPLISLNEAVANSITINSGAVLTMSGTYSLSITAGGYFSNNAGSSGFVASACTGALKFLGNGTISGTSTFNNVEYSGGLNFGTSSSVTGTVTIQAGGYTDIHGPTYLTGSLLKYNTGTRYNRRVEWSTSSGNSYPYNVLITGNTQVYASDNSALPANTVLNTAGDFTIDNGSQLFMDAFNGSNNMTVPLIVKGSFNLKGNLSLSLASGGDIYVAKDWNFTAGGNFYPNSRAVFFNGSTLQNISRSATGTLNFDYVVFTNTSGGIKLATGTSINFNKSGDGFQMLGSGTGNVFDLNGNTATMTAGGNIKISSSQIITSSTAANFNISVAGGNVNSGTSLEFGSNVTVNLNNGFDFGSSLSTIKGILSINPGGFVTGNAPTYFTNSVLLYNTTGTYSRNVEWGTTSGPGYPYHVTIQNGTTLDLSANGGTAKSCAGNLTLGVAGSAGSLSMGTMTTTLTVGGNVTIGNATGTSTLTLGDISGVNAGDIYVGGSWTRNANGVFNPGTGNGRAVFFNSSANASITASGGEIFPFLFIIKNALGNTVTLNDSIIITREIHFTKGTFNLSNSNVIIRSTSSNTACVTQVAATTDFVLNYSGTGKFFIERYIPMQTPYSGRRWRLMGIPVSSSSAPSINAAWQEGSTPTPTTASATATISAYNLVPGYGTHITNGIGSINNSNGFDAGSTANPSIYKMEPGSGAWTVPSSTGIPITNYKGYMLFVRGDRSIVVSNQYINTTGGNLLRIKGQINTGDVTVSTVAGKQILSNPYPSAISFNNVSFNGVTPGTTIGSSYYLWDPKLLGSKNVGGFVTFSSGGGSTYTYVPYTGGSTGMSSYTNAGIIESGEAFMINAAGTGNFIFHESDKLVTSSTTGIASRPAMPGRPQNPVSEFYTNLYYRDNTDTAILADGVAVTFGDDYHNEVDDQDAMKMQTFQTKEKISLLRNDSVLSIERRQTITADDTVFLQMNKLDLNYHYQLQFIPKNFANGLSAFLIDKYLSTFSPLSTDSSTLYKFETNSDPASLDVNRFMVVFKLKQGATVPVRFTEIKAWQKSISANEVEWKAADELNAKEYSIERSVDGIHFSNAATVAADGSGIYNWIDNNIFGGINYYRIISISSDNAKLYSSIVSVRSATIQNSSLVVYPDPVTNGMPELKFTNMPAGKYYVSLINDLGQKLIEKTIDHSAGSSTEILSLNKNISKGIYHLDILCPDNNRIILKLVNQ